ncbi:ATP F0F1 synthase subunit C, partial [Campylobacter coli]|nr:ATP F0F1 synthase subunit C [Campylobacter coli]
MKKIFFLFLALAATAFAAEANAPV